MKLRLLDHLVCPLDKTRLEFRQWESVEQPLESDDAARAQAMGLEPASLSTEILTGVLVNRSRKLLYPIHRGVPRMLTFETGIAREFANLHAARIRDEFSGYSF